MATGKVTQAIDVLTPKTPNSMEVIIGGGAYGMNEDSFALSVIPNTAYVTKEMLTSSLNPKVSVGKTGANIDVNGFIDVSGDVTEDYDLIGIYQNGGAIYSDIKFDPTALTVGPFDTSTPSSDIILLRFI